jgi:hypothetical protein
MFIHILILSFFALSSRGASDSSDASDSSNACGCYTLDSDTHPLFFSNHKFYDFRYLTSTSDKPTLAPSLVTTPGGHESSRDQDILASSGILNDWSIQDWSKKANEDAKYDMHNSPQNVYICESLKRDLKIERTFLPVMKRSSSVTRMEVLCLNAL